MIGLIVYIVVGIWCLLGWYLCRYLITKRVGGSPLKWALVLLFWVVWLVGPIADELVGRREFDEACAQLPEVKFFGPIHVGAGAFFDESGTRRWSNGKEFAQIQMNTREWDKIFDRRKDERRVASFPISIIENRTTIYHVSLNRPTIVAYSLFSTGGWIRRSIGWVNDPAWMCSSSGNWPRDEDLIVF